MIVQFVCVFVVDSHSGELVFILRILYILSLFHVQIPLLLEFTIIYIKRRVGRFYKCDVTYSKRRKYLKFKNKKPTIKNLHRTVNRL